MSNYLALIGDVIQSKQVANRGELQATMNQAFQTIHSQFPELIQSNFTLTLGDEFQALLTPSQLILVPQISPLVIVAVLVALVCDKSCVSYDVKQSE